MHRISALEATKERDGFVLLAEGKRGFCLKVECVGSMDVVWISAAEGTEGIHCLMIEPRGEQVVSPGKLPVWRRRLQLRRGRLVRHHGRSKQCCRSYEQARGNKQAHGTGRCDVKWGGSPRGWAVGGAAASLLSPMVGREEVAVGTERERSSEAGLVGYGCPSNWFRSGTSSLGRQRSGLRGRGPHRHQFKYNLK